MTIDEVKTYFSISVFNDLKDLAQKSSLCHCPNHDIEQSREFLDAMEGLIKTHYER